MAHGFVNTPFGAITVFADETALIAAEWGAVPEQGRNPLVDAALDQLNRYFDGTLSDFDLPLAPADSPFRQAMRDAMLAIPYGETRTYGQIAARIGSAARAVGAACATNPFPVIVPCHRVVGANGAMVGYTGGQGPQTKSALLALEGAIPQSLFADKG